MLRVLGIPAENDLLDQVLEAMNSNSQLNSNLYNRDQRSIGISMESWAKIDELLQEIGCPVRSYMTLDMLLHVRFDVDG